MVAPYPEGCLAVHTPISHTAFFPGGYGWVRTADQPAPAWPFGGVMILGQDFHSEDGYNASLARGYEDPQQPTWRNLRAILGARVSPEQCFFTNFYMGLRAGSATTGRYPGSHDPAFVERCRDFLRQQLDAQRPRLVLTLGAWVPRELALLSPSLDAWRDARGLRDIDRDNCAVVPHVRLHDGAPAVVAALSHPSLYPLTASRREYSGYKGVDAHQAILDEAMTLAGGRQ